MLAETRFQQRFRQDVYKGSCVRPLCDAFLTTPSGKSGHSDLVFVNKHWFGEDPQIAQQGGGSPYSLSLEDCPASVLFSLHFLKLNFTLCRAAESPYRAAEMAQIILRAGK